MAADEPSHLAKASAPVVENWMARKAAAVMEAFASFDPNVASLSFDPSLSCPIENAIVVFGPLWPHKFVETCRVVVEEKMPVLATLGRCETGVGIMMSQSKCFQSMMDGLNSTRLYFSTIRVLNCLYTEWTDPISLL